MADSPPESPLTSMSSATSDSGVGTPGTQSPLADIEPPPSKRRKMNDSSNNSNNNSRTSMNFFSAFDHNLGYYAVDDDDAASVELSEDTDGSAPGSPSHDEHALRADQVSTCQWEGCPVGDLGNSDDLVRHVQAEHISPKRAKYTCEWGDCARKGTNHPSGYALKAHMRSHTKEKPFFCALPECDRSFTRSDALAKHMRTVHEPEPPRPSAAHPIDPATGLPKKGPKIRLMNGGSKSAGSNSGAGGSGGDTTRDAHLDPSDPAYDPSPASDNIKYIPANHPVTGQAGFMITYPPDINFTQFESEIPADQLMRLLRRQIHWATQEGEDLKADIEQLEALRRNEWLKKEVLLEGTMENELAVAEDQDMVEDGLLEEMTRDVEPAKGFRWTKTPWWKKANGLPGDRRSDDGDAEDELERRNGAQASQTLSHAEASSKQAERDNDMMAVGALMGLSAGTSV